MTTPLKDPKTGRFVKVISAADLSRAKVRNAWPDQPAPDPIIGISHPRPCSPSDARAR